MYVCMHACMHVCMYVCRAREHPQGIAQSPSVSNLPHAERPHWCFDDIRPALRGTEPCAKGDRVLAHGYGKVLRTKAKTARSSQALSAPRVASHRNAQEMAGKRARAAVLAVVAWSAWTAATLEGVWQGAGKGEQGSQVDRGFPGIRCQGVQARSIWKGSSQRMDLCLGCRRP